MPKSLAELESLIGYKFKDIGLPERALTHRSWANEQADAGKGAAAAQMQNETLEFVGDSVLGLAIAEQLFLREPALGEGDLTLMKHHLVRSDSLAGIANALGLGSFIRLGRGEEKTGGRQRQTLLADTLEAIIGAVFFDGGYIQARALVNRLFAGHLREVTPSSSIDYKTQLQETLQSRKREAPVYKVVRTEGPSHDRTFWVEAVWDSGEAEGCGASIKSAEMEAAGAAFRKLKEETDKQITGD